jgi:hypothetical protein
MDGKPLNIESGHWISFRTGDPSRSGTEKGLDWYRFSQWERMKKFPAIPILR